MKLLNSQATFEMLQPFATIEQLNANTKAIRARLGRALGANDRAVLDFIHRHALRFFGVCYATKNTIAEACGISRRTVVRICNRLEALGVIAQYEMKREFGDKRQSSNAIVFLTLISAREAFVADSEVPSDNMQEMGDVPPDVTPLSPTKTPEKDIKDYTNDTEKEVKLKRGLVTKLPKALKDALAPFFNSDMLYELTGVVFKAKAAVDRDIKLEDNEQEYYDTILSVINAYKRGKIVNLPGVIYSAIQATTRSISIRQRMSAAFGF